MKERRGGGGRGGGGSFRHRGQPRTKGIVSQRSKIFLNSKSGGEGGLEVMCRDVVGNGRREISWSEVMEDFEGQTRHLCWM